VVGVDDRRPEDLMVIGLRTVAVVLHAAVPALDLVGGMVAGPVHRDQEVAAEHGPVLEDLSALQGGMDAREAAAEVAGVHLVKAFAHPRVRGRPLHAEQRAEVPRLDRILAAAHLRVELKQRPHLERKYREARHQAVGKAEVTSVDRVGNAVEACAHHAKHAGHRQMPAEGISGHFSARLCLFCRRKADPAQKVYEKNP